MSLRTGPMFDCLHMVTSEWSDLERVGHPELANDDEFLQAAVWFSVARYHPDPYRFGSLVSDAKSSLRPRSTRPLKSWHEIDAAFSRSSWGDKALPSAGVRASLVEDLYNFLDANCEGDPYDCVPPGPGPPRAFADILEATRESQFPCERHMQESDLEIFLQARSACFQAFEHDPAIWESSLRATGVTREVAFRALDHIVSTVAASHLPVESSIALGSHEGAAWHLDDVVGIDASMNEDVKWRLDELPPYSAQARLTLSAFRGVDTKQDVGHAWHEGTRLVLAFANEMTLGQAPYEFGRRALLRAIGELPRPTRSDILRRLQSRSESHA